MLKRGPGGSTAASPPAAARLGLLLGSVSSCEKNKQNHTSLAYFVGQGADQTCSLRHLWSSVNAVLAHGRCSMNESVRATLPREALAEFQVDTEATNSRASQARHVAYMRQQGGGATTQRIKCVARTVYKHILRRSPTSAPGKAFWEPAGVQPTEQKPHEE